ncbi:hypothetical protein JMJ77_0006954 [Colletotrichum scovillei]|uniref:Uncharacterized protein n=1 Tax=Colletotrichum scovillei TaxID=1209932 RepID=A0A9P7RC61_9PEZI|nr:hypothetical protein JMJ77_0006954 [Colletotrichum scovillei]KAG7073914.1 hypothetical protein JMJ76_0010409 [Colletotrichum scovillei]KAG7081463.1 hypothetical protein JMJ78_0003586 [Colletotrichum scovillei]
MSQKFFSTFFFIAFAKTHCIHGNNNNLEPEDELCVSSKWFHLSK